jgi:Ca-activated chloride channel homolog
MTFLSPDRLWFLAAIPLLIVAYVLMQARRKKYAVRFTNLALLTKVAPHRPGWRRHVAAVLFLFTILIMIVGFARPSKAVKVPRDRATIIVAIDVSPSMVATDVPPTREEAAKAAAKSFVQSLPARFNVGVVSFCNNASVAAAPTIDHQAVVNAISGLQLCRGTAIGEAVFTGLDAIHNFDAQAAQNPPPATIVLMSDGGNESGRSIDEAASAAQAAKVPVSTIAFGTPYGSVTIDGETVPVQVDKEALKALADGSHGNAYTSDSRAQLSQVYKHIGTSLGFTTQRQEVASRYVGVALLFAVAAALASLAWFARLP